MSRPSELAAGYSFGPALEARLERLVARGARREQIGSSREGRPIWGYTVPGAPDSVEPGSLVLALLHPMEWIGLEAALRLAERRLTRAPGAPLWLVPMVNVDGCARVQAALEAGRARWQRGNAAGVDLNRNFPRHFRARPSWLAAWPLYRPGSAPLSEPETRAVAEWTRGKSIGVSLSLHSFGRWIFYPPSASYAADARTAAHARHLAARAKRASLPGYRSAQLGRWSPLFRAYGTEIDWLAAETKGLAYLIEISAGGLGRWDVSRWLHPFFAFNPPRPERELDRLLPFLEELCAAPGS